MTYAAVIRAPGSPPTRVPSFAAKSDKEALAVISETAARLGASVVMAWESKGEEARWLS